MAGLQDREKAQESFFEHTQELEFRIKSRAYRYFGLWVAQQLEIDDTQEAQDYATNLVMQAFDKSITTPLEEIIHQRLMHKNITIFDIKDTLTDALNRSRLEIMGHGH